MSTVLASSFLRDRDFVDVLYIVAFSLFIYGLMGLTGPRTAVRGNRIAAVGMAIAVGATFLLPGMGNNWGLIILGLVIGTAVGIPSARQVKMTAIPQMVALFNGVGGGAVALIAWAEFNETGGYDGLKLTFIIPSLFAAIVGSVSFWGSNIAFGKLQEILPGHPISAGKAQQPINLLLLVAAVVAAIAIASGETSGFWIAVVLICSALLGLFVVLPIGGADMPVVISLLNAFTGLAASATGFVLSSTVLIVAGMLGSLVALRRITPLLAQQTSNPPPRVEREDDRDYRDRDYRDRDRDREYRDRYNERRRAYWRRHRRDY